MTQEQEKGTKMNRTKHSPKTPRTTTGFFGMLGGLFTSRGISAPSVSAISASTISTSSFTLHSRTDLG
jgi:hypothetical protein